MCLRLPSTYSGLFIFKIKGFILFNASLLEHKPIHQAHFYKPDE